MNPDESGSILSTYCAFSIGEIIMSKNNGLQSYVARKPSPLRRSGVSRIRTGDPLLAKQVLYQLSYNPFRLRIVDCGRRIGCSREINPKSEIRILQYGRVGLGGVEPPTSRLSGVRSNHLSYSPLKYSSKIESRFSSNFDFRRGLTLRGQIGSSCKEQFRPGRNCSLTSGKYSESGQSQKSDPRGGPERKRALFWR